MEAVEAAVPTTMVEAVAASITITTTMAMVMEIPTIKTEMEMATTMAMPITITMISLGMAVLREPRSITTMVQLRELTITMLDRVRIISMDRVLLINITLKPLEMIMDRVQMNKTTHGMSTGMMVPTD